MDQKFKNLFFYLKLPEMRPFWIFLPFILAVLALNLFYLAGALKLVSGLLLISVSVFVFWGSYRTTQAGFGARLERSELRSIVAGLQDALIAYDQSFKMSFFNPAAEALFGLPAKNILGREMHPGDVENQQTQLLAQVIFPSLAPSLTVRSKTGEYPQIADLSFTEPQLELRVVTAPVADEKGRLLGFMKIVRDRTREISLLRSKTEFITVASHQLRTPTTELNWAVQTISQDPGLSDTDKELAQNAVRSAKKLETIVEDLLNTSRIEEGRFGYNFEQTDLVAYVEKILSEVMPQVQRAGLKLYFDKPQTKLPPVMIDVQKLSMVLSNLLDNAVRYNVQNGEITVSARAAAEGPYVEVSVKDTGIGVPPEQIKKLFMKFFRADNAVKSQADGSGLGLYIAKNIIAAHGGRMWAESELNRGTTFHFTLPTDPALVPTQEVALE